jgi:hypothetical protein
MISSINERNSSYKGSIMNPAAKLAKIRELEQIYNFDYVSQADSITLVNSQNNPYHLNNPNLISAIGKPPLNASVSQYSKRNLIASERGSMLGATSNST